MNQEARTCVIRSPHLCGKEPAFLLQEIVNTCGKEDKQERPHPCDRKPQYREDIKSSCLQGSTKAKVRPLREIIPKKFQRSQKFLT